MQNNKMICPIDSEQHIPLRTDGRGAKIFSHSNIHLHIYNHNNVEIVLVEYIYKVHNVYVTKY